MLIFAPKSLIEGNEIVQKTGLSEMTMEEIDAEIRAVRDVISNS